MNHFITTNLLYNALLAISVLSAVLLVAFMFRLYLACKANDGKRVVFTAHKVGALMFSSVISYIAAIYFLLEEQEYASVASLDILVAIYAALASAPFILDLRAVAKVQRLNTLH